LDEMAVMPQEFKVGKAKISLVLGDLTEATVDAIVNAANQSLMGGGGVDGAVHRKGGPTIIDECIQIRKSIWPDGLPTGKAVITSGGNLKAKYIIHTVGPIWQGGSQGEPELLANAYTNSLRLAVANNLKTVAFPSISTGAYGYPVDKASRIALESTKRFLETRDNIDAVVFYLFSERDFRIYNSVAQEIIPS
jgi:O-acetyl-ADP-ribose deacetylase (regulator of RNase III)